MSGTRDENVFMARLAEQAERYEDMVRFMTAVANMGSELSTEERNLLSVAFKNAVGARRSAWRQIAGMIQHQKEKEGKEPPKSVIDYQARVEQELNAKCDDILQLLRKEPEGLISAASRSNREAEVFYRKMEGDYERYLAEFSQGESQAQHAQRAFQAYENAMHIAKQAMPAAHPIRLGLALNFSVFYYEVYGKSAAACDLAQASFDAGMAELSADPNACENKDAENILVLLRDNLSLWRSEGSGQGEGKPPEQDGTRCEDL